MAQRSHGHDSQLDPCLSIYDLHDWADDRCQLWPAHGSYDLAFVARPSPPRHGGFKTTVSNRYEEMIRLNRALKGMLMPVDLLVISEQEFEARSRIPGTVEHAACREGRVLYAAA